MKEHISLLQCRKIKTSNSSESTVIKIRGISKFTLYLLSTIRKCAIPLKWIVNMLPTKAFFINIYFTYSLLSLFFYAVKVFLFQLIQLGTWFWWVILLDCHSGKYSQLTETCKTTFHYIVWSKATVPKHLSTPTDKMHVITLTEELLCTYFVNSSVLPSKTSMPL